MNTITKSWRIVLISRPLSPLVAFAYYLLSHAGHVGGSFLGKHYTRWTVSSKEHEVEAGMDFREMGIIVHLNISEGNLHRLIESIFTSPFSPYPRYTLKKVKTFFYYLQRNRYIWEKWLALTGKLSYYSEPAKALQVTSYLIDQMINNPDDLTMLGNGLNLKITNPFRAVDVSSDQREVPMPVTKRRNEEPDEAKRREVIDYTSKFVSERSIFELEGDQTTLLIGGSPGVGKSTLASSLCIAINREIRSLRTREGIWKTLDLSCELVTLDAATEVAPDILNREGQNREKINAKKRPWDVDLAKEVVRRIKIPTSNIILADLPGKVTDITRLLAVRGTYGIFLGEGKDWITSLQEWRGYFRYIGVPVIAQIKSTESPSMMITLMPGSGLSGRVQRLDRLIKDWDPFIRTMAEFLLFDVLPGRVGRIHNQIEKQASLMDWDK